MLAKNTPEKSRRFLAGLGAGIAAASLTLGLTVRSAAEPATEAEPRDAGSTSLQVPTKAASPTSTETPQPPPPSAATTATAAPSRSPSPKPTSAKAVPRRTASPTPQSKTQSPEAKQKTKPAAAPSRTSVEKPVTTGGPTSWSALNTAIARIPGYRQGGIRWAVTARYGHYGTTDLATSEIFISPGVPLSLLDSVARHEYAHVVTVRAYGGDWQRAKSALNIAYGGSGMTGVERAADCMAKAIGATWLHHTACTSSAWQAMARQLLAGRPV